MKLTRGADDVSGTKADGVFYAGMRSTGTSEQFYYDTEWKLGRTLDRLIPKCRLMVVGGVYEATYGYLGSSFDWIETRVRLMSRGYD